MKETNFVYLGVKAHVVCINAVTGEEIWRTKIKRSQLISIVVEEGLIVAHAGGQLFGLDKSSGKVLWNNKLPGLGYGYCFLATENSSSSSLMNNALAAISSSNDGGDSAGDGD
jgi:outer membrane protein assembly factor BamB